MKVTLGRLANAMTDPLNPVTGEPLLDDEGKKVEAPLSRLIKEADEGKMCVRTKFHILKVFRLVVAEMESYQKARNGLFEKYGEKGEGDSWSVKPDSPKWEEFVKEHSELSETEVELDVDVIVLPADNTAVKITTIAALEGMVTMRGMEDDKPALKVVKKED